MQLEGKRIVVTGADGFIGSHLAEALVGRGCEVRALVQYNSLGSRGWLDDLDPAAAAQIEVIPGDVRDGFAMRELVRGCDVVLHLAALIAIPYSYRAPEAYVETNVKGTLNLVQAAREHGVTRFVHTSTSEVYGSALTVPMTEQHPLQPQSPYSASKIAADQLALSFFHAFDLPVTVCRPFNTFGPRQSARAVIPTIIAQIAAGQREIRLGAVHPRRDFTYVTDTVEGLIAAATCEAAVGQTVHLGTGYDIAIGDLAAMIIALMDADATVVSSDERRRPEGSEVERLLSDNTKARELLKWRPRLAGDKGLRDGLRHTIDWLARPANLARYRPAEYQL